MNPRAIVDKMMDKDAFSRWLGIEVLKVEEGYSLLSMQVRAEILNGFSIAHGGISYSLADSALAFAANSRGIQSVSIETQISHLKPCKEGDTIVAEAKEISLSNKFARYLITIRRDEEKIAVFYGTVFRTGNVWEVEEHSNN